MGRAEGESFPISECDCCWLDAPVWLGHPCAHPLSIHFPSAQVIKKHLCFSIRLHIWGQHLSHHLEGRLKSPLELSCGVAQGPISVSPSGDRGDLGNHGSTEPASKWPKPPRTSQHRAPGGAVMPALTSVPAFAQANSLYPHENQWMEQIVLNYVK